MSVLLFISACVGEEMKGTDDIVTRSEADPVASLEAQVAAMKESIRTLSAAAGDMDRFVKELETLLKSLTERAQDYEAQYNACLASWDTAKAEIEALASELAALRQEVRGDIDRLNALLAGLKDTDASLEKKIADLEAYVASVDFASEEWVSATFATLEKQEEIAAVVAEVKTAVALVEQYLESVKEDTGDMVADRLKEAAAELDAALEADVERLAAVWKDVVPDLEGSMDEQIAAMEASVKSWISTELEAYYTTVELEAALKLALETEPNALLVAGINGHLEEVTGFKEDLLARYQELIKTAIEDNEGVFTAEALQTIEAKAGELADIESGARALIGSLTDRVAAIELVLPSVQEQIASVERTIEELDILHGNLKKYLDAVSESHAALSEGMDEADALLAGLMPDFETEYEQILLVEISAMKSELDAALEDADARIGMLHETDTQIEGLLTELEQEVESQLETLEQGMSGTYALLTLQAEVADAIVTLRTQAEFFTTSLADLKASFLTRVQEFEAAMDSFETDLKSEFETMTAAYEAALATAVAELEAAYESYLDEAVAAVESEAKEWFGKQLASYYSSAALEAALKTATDSFEGRLNSLSGQMADKISDMESLLSDRIDKNAEDLDALMEQYSQLGTAGAVEMHLKRTQENASKIAANSEQIQKNASAIADNKTEADKLQNLVEENKTLIEINQQALDVLKSEVESLSSEETALGESLADMAVRISEQTEDIATLASTAAEHGEQIAANTAASQKNADDIMAFESALEQTKAEIEAAYKALIAEKIPAGSSVDLDQVEADFNSRMQEFESLVSSLSDRVTELETAVPDLLERLEVLSGKAEDLEKIFSQIQSVSLMSDFTDKSVYAPYAKSSSFMTKLDVELKYLVRPAEAASALAANWEGNMSAKVYYQQTRADFTFNTLDVKSVGLEGDIMTVTVDPSGISDAFYNGDSVAQLALEINDGNTQVISDFATLVPKKGSAISITYAGDVIPAIKGMTVTIPFKYASSSDDCTIQIANAQNVVSATCTKYDASKTGQLLVTMSDSDIASQKVDLVLTSGDDTYVEEVTFSDAGEFAVEGTSVIDHIGGEVALRVTANPFQDTNVAIDLNAGGAWVTSRGSSGGYNIYSVAENDGAQRTGNIKVSMVRNGLTYVMYHEFVQYASGTPLQAVYHSDGSSTRLQTAGGSGYVTPLNIVILGDGYTQKDLAVGGKFERSAKSAMESFFGIEPFAHFRERFNVWMIARKSNEEGTDNQAASTDKDTYFNTYWSGSGTKMWVEDDGMTRIKNDVSELGVGLYRTVAIVLVNTDADAGSASYIDRTASNDYISEYGEAYRHFGVAVLAANSTGTNGLVKHEAGGHAFGRLADEYTEGNGTVYSGDLSSDHAEGMYRNVCTDKAYWNDLYNNTAYAGRVGYIEGGRGYSSGIYKSTSGGIMYNNQGEFNAVSRRIIYERIIRQTEGSSAYTASKFLEYDKKNLN